MEEVCVTSRNKKSVAWVMWLKLDWFREALSLSLFVLLLVDGRSDIGVRGGGFGKSRMVLSCRFRGTFDDMVGLGWALR